MDATAILPILKIVVLIGHPAALIILKVDAPLALNLCKVWAAIVLALASIVPIGVRKARIAYNDVLLGCRFLCCRCQGLVRHQPCCAPLPVQDNAACAIISID